MHKIALSKMLMRQIELKKISDNYFFLLNNIKKIKMLRRKVNNQYFPKPQKSVCSK